MSWPLDPIAAVTHPDPYPYYASLVAQSPWYFDPKLKMWIASGASSVNAVMGHSLCQVRPAEKIPRVLQNTPAEIIFSHLIRMNDGAEFQKSRQRIRSFLGNEAGGSIRPRLQNLAARLWSEQEDLTRFQFDFSVHVMGHLLGFPDRMLPQLARLIGDFVHCLAPQSRPEQIQAGIQAAGLLLDLFRARIDDHAAVDHMAANGIGLLSQAYEATAGLISNSCLALARCPSHDIPALVRDTVRLDPPVQNTRRFLADDAVIEGCAMRKGDCILLLLAGAASFGIGAHQCPGESLALMLAETAIEHLLTLDQSLETLTEHFHYRPSANTRIALFHKP